MKQSKEEYGELNNISTNLKQNLQNWNVKSNINDKERFGKVRKNMMNVL